MTRIEWDKIEDREYETGVDRGVICPLDSYAAIPWNGLISVSEDATRDSKVYHQDSIKLFERLLGTSYSAKIQAFTYPDAVDELVGKAKFAPGVSLHDQFPGRFHLAYRTLIGNASDGVDHGYKLHVVWNLLIRQDGTEFQTIGDQISPSAFGWSVTSTPSLWVAPDGSRKAINHISIDSREIDPALLAQIEADLYGTDDYDGQIYDPDAFMGYFTG